MGGGLLQLVAYGAQDVYLTGNPQITFFKVVYRRHTNFAIESIQQTFNGTPNFGQTVYCQVSRNGDLIHRAYVQVTLPPTDNYSFISSATDRYVNYIGLRLLKSVTIEIGGQQIDKHYSDWLYIWNELSLPLGKKIGWNAMVGADGDIVSSRNNMSATYSVMRNSEVLYIPLEFWFCRNIGLALPLIALQYHEVKLKIEFETIDNCIYQMSGANTIAASANTKNLFANSLNAVMWIDYIFLDTDERRRFAQLSHEYLIEQLQFTGQETLTLNANRIKLNFNHPCKELIWVAKQDNASRVFNWYNYTADQTLASFNIPEDPGSTSSFQFGSRPLQVMPNSSSNYTSNASVASVAFIRELFNVNSNMTTFGSAFEYSSNVFWGFTPNGTNPFTDCLLQLNGNDRFDRRFGTYFNYVQPYQHHTCIPRNKGINVYSFALKPEEHQPSGTLNMSRIDTAVLSVTSTVGPCSINIYAVNYNVLRILSGMGGLAYSN